MLNEKPQQVLTDQWITDKMTKSQKLAFDERKEEGKSIKEIIPEEFHDFIPTVFSERPIGELPTRKPYDHAIDLVPDFKAQRQHPFHMDEKQKKAVEEFVEESLAKGFIRDLKSPQTSALFFVPKTDGRLRPVQDYQYINRHTIRNAYPLPRIDDLVDKMKDFDCYVKMDIRWGYNNVRIKEGDEWKAAFSCHLGSFEPLVMYFGLTNSPATFQAMMNDIFREEMLQGWLMDYMDDLMICGKHSNMPELIDRGRRILQKLRDNDLFIKPDKCAFFVSQVDFLSFVVSNGQLKMNDAKVDGIAKWPPPENVSQLRSFLGFCNFYYRFIDHYSDKCQPLNLLLQKSRAWSWTVDQHTAFENLKAAYTSKPVLLMPDRTKPYEIKCDASLFATGAVLLQQDTNGDWHPVAFYSKSMSATERNYQVYDRELMAVICSLQEWRCYIYGSDFTTIVWTDHHNLTYYMHPQKLTRRQVRWMVELMDYDIKLQHKAGSKMIVADALSRRADWLKGIEADNDQVVALPDNLWIRLLDTELQDAVAKGLKNDSVAQEAMKRLSETEVSPTNWTLEPSGDDSSTPFLFYNGRLYVPDKLDLRHQVVSDHHDTPTAGHP